MTTPVTTSAPSDATLEVAGRRKRMLTGDRPTGKLHLGHFVGSVENRIRLQEEYEAFFIIADLHMLTTKNARADIDQVSTNARDMVLDQLSAGIDPEKATFYLQSAIPEVSELNTLFQNLVTVPRLERVPSLKDMARAAGKDEMPYGLLGYPVLQAADILCVKGDVVPVGKDNHAHVEVTREIARRFNNLYGEVFPIPELVISEITTLVGTDGQAKMSKSPGQHDPAVRRRRHGSPQGARDVHRPQPDPRRHPGDGRGEPGLPLPRRLQPGPRRGGRPQGAVPRRSRRRRRGQGEARGGGQHVPRADARAPRTYESRPGYVDEIIVDGTERTRVEVKAVVAEVKKAMGITGTYNQLRRKAEQARKRRGE